MWNIFASKPPSLLGVDWVDFRAKMGANTVVIDVRTAAEFRGGYIYGAIHLGDNTETFMAALRKLPKSKTYLLYSNHHTRSMAVGQQMLQLGFKQVYYLHQGLGGWAGNLVLG